MQPGQSYHPGKAPRPKAQPIAIGPWKVPRTVVVVIAAILGLALVAGAGVVAARVLFPTRRPAEALPANCFVYGELNLSPRVDQLVAMGSFLQKVQASRAALDPNHNQTSISVGNTADPKQAFVEGLAQALGLTGFSYATDVKPWLGDRVGYCLTSVSGDSAVMAVATPNPSLALTGLRTLFARYPRLNGGAYIGTVDGYVLVASSNAALSNAMSQAAAGSTLARQATFGADNASFDSASVASGWMTTQTAVPLIPGYDTHGVHGSVQLLFDASYASLDLRVAGLPTSQAIDGSVTDLMAALPADTTAAAGTSSPTALAALVSAFTDGTSVADGMRSFARQYGALFPADVEAYAGQAAAVGMSRRGSSDMFGLIKSRNPGATGQRLSTAASTYRTQQCSSCALPVIVVGSDKVALAATGDRATQLVNGGSALGAGAWFSQAIDPHDTALVYIETGGGLYLQHWANSFLGVWSETGGPIRAVGLSGSSRADGTGHVVLRLVA